MFVLSDGITTIPDYSEVLAMELYTLRLQLREFQEDDWPAVHEYNSDPEVFQYLPSDPGSEEQSRQLVQWCLTQSQASPRT